MQKRKQKKMQITIIPVIGMPEKTKTISFLDNSEMYQKILNFINDTNPKIK